MRKSYKKISTSCLLVIYRVIYNPCDTIHNSVTMRTEMGTFLGNGYMPMYLLYPFIIDNLGAIAPIFCNNKPKGYKGYIF